MFGRNSDARFVARRRGKALLVAAVLAGTVIQSVAAQAQGLGLIRDTEIEALLDDYARPVFRAAGLGTGRVTVRIVRSDTFNAFVVDGRNVFVNTGTLMQSDTPNQVIGVIAHESGHIAGIVNPPSKKKYGHYTSDAPIEDPDTWKADAEYHEGSWWPRWEEWLRARSGKMIAARPLPDSVLAAAPGTYVVANPNAGSTA